MKRITRYVIFARLSKSLSNCVIKPSADHVVLKFASWTINASQLAKALRPFTKRALKTADIVQDTEDDKLVAIPKTAFKTANCITTSVWTIDKLLTEIDNRLTNCKVDFDVSTFSISLLTFKPVKGVSVGKQLADQLDGLWEYDSIISGELRPDLFIHPFGGYPQIQLRAFKDVLVPYSLLQAELGTRLASSIRELTNLSKAL